MIYFKKDKTNFIYVHIPKSAGTSISESLINNYPGSEHLKKNKFKKICKKEISDFVYDQFFDHLPAWYIDPLLKTKVKYILVVRNPWARMFSLFQQHMLGRKKGDDKYIIDLSLDTRSQYSIYFEKLFKKLQIHAFEPVKTTYDQLQKNITLNQSGLIHTNNFGIADKDGTVDFFVSPSVLAASSLADTFQTNDKIKVKGEIRRLDDYCSEKDILPDFIKCDVEGAELEGRLHGDEFMELLLVMNPKADKLARDFLSYRLSELGWDIYDGD